MNFRDSGFSPQGFGHLLQQQEQQQQRQEQQMWQTPEHVNPWYVGPPWSQPLEPPWGKESCFS